MPAPASVLSPQPPLPALRQDLTLRKGPPDNNGAANWLIYDPVRHRYFQIDAAAFELLAIWRPIAAEEFIVHASQQLGRDVEADELEHIVKFLQTSNLTDAAPGGDARAYAHQVAGTKRSLVSRTIHNYLFFKVPLVRPQRFLAATLVLVAPLYTRACLYVVTALTLIGLYLASRQWEAFTTTFMDFLSLEGAIAYGLSLIVIKTLHELGHAYTATRAGVRVNTMGIAFMVMMPILYTDVTDAWKLKSRRDKLAIAGAGLVVELAVAGIATFLWVFLPDGPMRSAAFVLATLSWIMSVAVNLNPFMRFDGYYLLADAWGIPNLQTRAFALGRWWLRETLFGLRHAPPEPFARRTRKLLIAYAIGTWIYRLVLFLGIALLVYHMFFKALGVLLFAIEIIWFIGLPIWREFVEWWKMRGGIVKSRRSLVTAGICAALVAIILIPWSGTVRVPAVAKFGQEFAVFAPRPAHIKAMALADGAVVSKGTRLAVLKAPELEHQIRLTQQEISLVEARLRRIAGDRKDRSLRDVLVSQMASHREKLEGLRKEAERMVLVAPFKGVIRDTKHGLRAGDWIDQATPIARLVDARRLDAMGYIHEDDVWKISAGQRVYFVPEDPLLASRQGRITDVAATGTRTIEIPYLASVYGGSVPSDRNDEGDIRPRSGRYLVKVALDGKPLTRVQRGTLHIAGRPESIAAMVWRRILQVLVRESGV